MEREMSTRLISILIMYTAKGKVKNTEFFALHVCYVPIFALHFCFVFFSFVLSSFSLCLHLFSYFFFDD